MSQKQYIQIFLIVLLTFALGYTGSSNCIHDKIKVQPQFTEKLQEPEQIRRALQITNPEPLRITFDVSGLSNVAADKLEYILNLLEISTNFFADTLQVQRLTSNNIVPSGSDTCVDYTIPDSDKNVGIADSDLHIYVSETTDSGDWRANASYCILDGSTNRPLFGRLQFNMNQFGTSLNVDNNLTYEDNLEAVQHEITHILGFSSDMIQFWKDPSTGQAYTSPTGNLIIRGQLTTILKTPKVLEHAREYYNCSSLQGMPFENFGTEDQIGSHWKNTILENEFMTSESHLLIAQYSKFTFALLEDTGFYKPVYDNLDLMSWGYQKGCNFILTCDPSFEEFQDRNSILMCDYNNNAITQSNNDPHENDCIYVRANQNAWKCFDPLVVNSQPTSIFGTHGGYNGKCFNSNILRTGYNINAPEYRCLQFECEGQDEIKILLLGEKYDCDRTTNTCEITPKGNADYNGYVNVPSDWDRFCNRDARVCPDFCSQNGYCMQNQCFCNDGFAGINCGVACDGVVSDGVCIPNGNCPSGKVLNNANKVCEQPDIVCEQQCEGCSGTADNCAACAGGITRSDAPTCGCSDGFFENGEIECSECQYPCENCTSETECSSCKTTENRSDNTTCGCQSGYYETGSACERCPYPCETCENGDSCQSCRTTENRVDQTSCDCAETYFDNGQSCEECPYPCDTCNDQGECLTCQDSEIRDNTNSDCACIGGYFETGSECQQCDTQCSTCSGSSDNCGQCANTQNREDAPGCGCSSGFYLNTTNNTCVDCVYPCETCTSATDCLSCQNPDNRSNSTTCECSDGFFEHNQACQECSVRCSTCSGTSDNCESCASNSSNTPQCLCDEGYFRNDQEICESCQYPCEDCSSVDVCLSCKYPDNKSVENDCACNSGFFEQNQRCEECVYPCQECSGSATNCTSCKTTLNRNTNTCQCNNGYFDNNSSCQQCSYKCATCEDNADQCLTCSSSDRPNTPDCGCATGYDDGSSSACASCNHKCGSCSASGDPDICDNGSCSDPLRNPNDNCSCPENYFDNGSATCQNCQAPCQDCNSLTECVSCVSENRDADNGCACSAGYYQNSSQNCVQCLDKCATCSNGTSCDTCKTDNQLRKTVVPCGCINGYYETENLQCEQCSGKCGTCESSADNCLSCNPQAEHRNQNLPCGCINGYFENAQGICEICSYKCDQCAENADSCTVCSQGTGRNSTICECEIGYYDNGTENCVECDGACEQCSSASVCTQCGDGYYLENNSCVQCQSGCNICNGQNDCSSCVGANRNNDSTCSCEDGYYNVEGQQDCQACLDPCDNCSSENQCTSCIAGFLFVNGNCEPCQEPCQECANSQQECTSCVDGYIFLDNQCQKCDEKCVDCENTVDSCTECQVGGVGRDYNSQNCDCLDTYYEVANQLNCEECVAPCQTCESGTKCLTCQDGFFLRGTECRPCSSKCATCDNADTCLTCQAGIGRNENGPDCGCRDGYYELDGQLDCGFCQAPCGTCSTSQNQCDSCVERENQNESTCQCNQGFYSDVTDTECLPCADGCQYCTDANTCLDESHCNQVGYDIDFPAIDQISLRFNQPLKSANYWKIQFSERFSYWNCRSLFKKKTRNLLGYAPQCQIQQDDNYFVTVTIKLSYTTRLNPTEDIFKIRKNRLQKYSCSEAITQLTLGDLLYENRDFSSLVPSTTISGKPDVQSCEEIELCTGAFTNDGKRAVEILSWSVTSSLGDQDLTEINSLIQNSGSQLSIQANKFTGGSQLLTFTVNYQNFLGVQGTTQKQVQLNYSQSIGMELLNQGDLIFKVFESNLLKIKLEQQGCGTRNVVLQTVNYQIFQADSDYVPLDGDNSLLKEGTSQNLQTLIKYKLEKYTHEIDYNYYIVVYAWINENEKYQLNIKYTYDYSDLVVGIQGGDREVSSTQSLQLHGFAKDLDVEDNQSEGIDIQWTCVDSVTESSCLVNGEFVSFEENSAEQQIDLSELQEDKVFIFTMVATKGDRVSQTSVQITIDVREVQTPDIEVTISDFVLYRKVSPYEDLKFRIIPLSWDLNLCYIQVDLNLIYEGELLATKSYNYRHFRVSIDEFDQELDGEDSTVILQAVVRLPGYDDYIVNFTVEVNFPPQIGELSIEPASGGISLSTEFKIEAINCDDADQPLLYQFKVYTSLEEYQNEKYYRRGDYDNILTTFRASPVLNTVLPRAREGQNLVIELIVKDNLGSISSTYKEVQIQALEIDQLYEKASELLDVDRALEAETRILNILAIEFYLSNAGNLGDSDLSQFERDLYYKLQDIQQQIESEELDAQVTKSINLLLNSPNVAYNLLPWYIRWVLYWILRCYRNYVVYLDVEYTSGQDLRFTIYRSLNQVNSMCRANRGRYQRLLEESGSDGEAVLEEYQQYLENLETVNQILEQMNQLYENSEQLPNSERISYDGDLVQTVIQKQAYILTQDLVNSLEGLENLIDQEFDQSGVSQQQQVKIFDESVENNDELAQQEKIYDVQTIVYKENIEKYSEKFYYKEQETNVVNVNIKEQNSVSEISLKSGYNIGYEFKPAKSLDLEQQLDQNVCIQQNTEGDWLSNTCNTTYQNSLIYCECSQLGKTTVVQDYDYIYHQPQNNIGTQGDFIEKTEISETIIFYSLLIVVVTYGIMSIIATLFDLRNKEDNKICDIKIMQPSPKRNNINNNNNNIFETENNTIATKTDLDTESELYKNSHRSSVSPKRRPRHQRSPSKLPMIKEDIKITEEIKEVDEEMDITSAHQITSPKNVSSQFILDQKFEQVKKEEKKKISMEEENKFNQNHNFISILLAGNNSRLSKSIIYFSSISIALGISCSISQSVFETDLSRNWASTIAGLVTVLILTVFNFISLMVRKLGLIAGKAAYYILIAILLVSGILSIVMTFMEIDNMTQDFANKFGVISIFALMIDLAIVQSGISAILLKSKKEW